MDKSARAPAGAYARRRAQALACAYLRMCATYTLPYAGWSCESAFIASCVACVQRRKCQAVATNPRARACSPIAVWTRYHGYRHAYVAIARVCTCWLYVRMRPAAGSCCGLGSALHTLSSGSSVRRASVSLPNLYKPHGVFIDRRLRTDHPCGMLYVRAHVHGHERPCVRGRACV
jgi:hypothetical protein